MLNCEPILQSDKYVKLIDCDASEGDFIMMKAKLATGISITQEYPKHSMFNFKVKMEGFAKFI